MVVYETQADYAPWFKLIFLIPVGLIIGGVIAVFGVEVEASIPLIIEGAFVGLLFYFILPRKYQVLQDRLRIVLGAPFHIDIYLSSIKEVKPGSRIRTYAYSGVRFATSTKNVVEITRFKGMNYVISPQNSGFFMEQLSSTIKEAARYRF